MTTEALRAKLEAAHDWLGVTGRRRVEVIQKTLGDKALEFDRRWSRVGREQAIAELPDHHRPVIEAAVREWAAAHAEWSALHDQAGDEEFKEFIPRILQTLRGAGGSLSLTMLNQTIKGHEYRFTTERLKGLELDVRPRGSGYRIWLQ